MNSAYMSLSYKVISCTDESPNYRVNHIENKNPSRYWSTAQPCEFASFEIKFNKSRLNSIEVMNTLSPQFSVDVFNMENDQIVDFFSAIGKTTLIPVNEFMQNKAQPKSKKFTLDKFPISKKEYSYMRVTVYNPYHDEKPSILGLISFIVIAQVNGLPPSLSTPSRVALDQLDKEVTERLKKSIGLDKLESGVPTENPARNNRRVTMFDDIEDVDRVPYGTPKRVPGRGIDEHGTVLKRGYGAIQSSSDLLGGIRAETKKIKPNPGREGELRRLRTYADQDEDREKDDFLKALRESERTHQKEQEKRKELERKEMEYEKEAFSYRKKNERKTMFEMGEPREKTQDLDDFQRALEESKKTYMKENGMGTEGIMTDDLDKEEKLYKENLYKENLYEEKKENGRFNFGIRKLRRPEITQTVNVEDPEEVRAYYEMLEKCADEEDLEAEGIVMEDGDDEEEIRRRNNREEDELTDILENSMANLWADSQQEAKSASKENEVNEMEIELMEDYVPKKKQELLQAPVQDRYGHVSSHYRSFSDMMDLGMEDYSYDYIEMERKARRELERKQGRKRDTVEVVSSHQDILKGLVFSLSGFFGDEKKQLKDMVVSMGARFQDELYPGVTTHLVTKSTKLNKYQTAVNMKNVIIVSRDWVDMCYEQRKRLDEKDFLMNDDEVQENVECDVEEG